MMVVHAFHSVTSLCHCVTSSQRSIREGASLHPRPFYQITYNAQTDVEKGRSMIDASYEKTPSPPVNDDRSRVVSLICLLLPRARPTNNLSLPLSLCARICAVYWSDESLITAPFAPKLSLCLVSPYLGACCLKAPPSYAAIPPTYREFNHATKVQVSSRALCRLVCCLLLGAAFIHPSILQNCATSTRHTHASHASRSREGDGRMHN